MSTFKINQEHCNHCFLVGYFLFDVIIGVIYIRSNMTSGRSLGEERRRAEQTALNPNVLMIIKKHMHNNATIYVTFGFRCMCIS